MRECDGPTRPTVFVAGQNNASRFDDWYSRASGIDGWVGKAGPAKQPSLMAGPTGPTVWDVLEWIVAAILEVLCEVEAFKRDWVVDSMLEVLGEVITCGVVLEEGC